MNTKNKNPLCYINIYECEKGHRDATCHKSREDALDELIKNSDGITIDFGYVATIEYSDNMVFGKESHIFHLENEALEAFTSE